MRVPLVPIIAYRTRHCHCVATPYFPPQTRTHQPQKWVGFRTYPTYVFTLIIKAHFEGVFALKHVVNMGFSHLTPYVNLEVLVIFGGVFALKKLNFYTQVGVVRKPHFSAISGPFFEDFGINLVTDGWSSTGFGRGGFLDADPMGFFEAGEGRIDKGGKIETGPMFTFDIHRR